MSLFRRGGPCGRPGFKKLRTLCGSCCGRPQGPPLRNGHIVPKPNAYGGEPCVRPPLPRCSNSGGHKVRPYEDMVPIQELVVPVIRPRQNSLLIVTATPCVITFQVELPTSVPVRVVLFGPLGLLKVLEKSTVWFLVMA